MLHSPTPMHIPDGFLSIGVALLMWALTIAVLAVALRRVGDDMGEKQIPLMGIMAAFIFAAQMINFPVAGGTSGHLLGGALAAITLGPWAGMLVMSSVIIVQGFLFQDGGLLAMGANIFNMGLITAMIGFGLYRSVAGRPRSLKLIVAGVAAWLSVMASALVTALQLWLSSAARLDIVVPAMLGVHALIGLGEALITVAALAFIFTSRPDILKTQAVQERGGRGWVLAGFLVVLAVLIISPLASADPDGLERVAIDLGFFQQSASAPFELLPDYTIPFLGSTSLSTIVAGVVGALIVAGVTVLVFRLIQRNSASRAG